MDILILNTAVVDIRSSEFDFIKTRVKSGGFLKCSGCQMPTYSQDDYKNWIKMGKAHVGGPGNCAPLLSRAGLKVSVSVNLGSGEFDGLDILGRLFRDCMLQNKVDVSEIHIHPTLPTGVSFIYADEGQQERGAIVYFPNANDDFDLDGCKLAVKKLMPKIVYYMYVGLSAKADARDGKYLGEFLSWCQSEGVVTIVDSATCAENPEHAIRYSQQIPEYKLLNNILNHVDIFFTSYDEARIIANTLFEYSLVNRDVLTLLEERFQNERRSRLWGITYKNGASVLYSSHKKVHGPVKITSDYSTEEIVDLVGAGDAFRAGVLAYTINNLEEFQSGSFDYKTVVSMGNLFASKYIQASLSDRYGDILSYPQMLKQII